MSEPTPSLTLAEARERSRLLSVESYDVTLDLTRGDEVAGSRTEVRFACTEPGASTFVELTARRLRSATLNGRLLPDSAYASGRIALDGLDAGNVLVVDAEVEYARTGDGLYRTVDPEDGATYVGAYVGVVNAQLVFACFDQPDLKARIATRVLAPLGWTVVGNGRVVTDGSGTGDWVLAATPPISPYLFAVVAGPLHVVSSEHRGTPMALYCRRALADHLDREASEILEITRACFDRYAELFTEPYPFDKYDQAFVPGLNWGALEQVGCIVIRDEYVFTSAVTDDQRLNRANLIAHEMAHMWFGDLVTLHWWDDIWLNESFAEYMGSQIVTDATRFVGAWELFGAHRKPWGYDADERPSTHPVAPDEQDVTDTARALENFDGISYAKGASALRQLAAWLGADHFVGGIDDLLSERRFATATLTDVLDSLERRSGRDVHGWADAWLRTSGYDTLTVERSGGELAVVHPGVRPHLVTAGLYDRDPSDASRLVLRADVAVRLEPGEPRVVLAFEGDEPEAVVLCHGDLTFAQVRADSRTDAALTDSLSSVASTLARVVTWVSWRDQLRHGGLSPADYLERVARHLSVERDPVVADSVLSVARVWAADRFLPPRDHDAALALLRGVCDSLLALSDDTRSPSLRLVALRWMIQSSGADQVGALRAALASGHLSGVELDEDLRWRALVRLASLGALELHEIDAALAAAPTETAGLHAVRARSARPDPEAKRVAWALMTATEGDLASTHEVEAAASGFWQTGQSHLTDAYVEAYLPAVAAVFAERGSWVAEGLLSDGFPWHVDDGPLVEALQELTADTEAPSTLRRYVGDRAYDHGLAIDVRARWGGQLG